MYQQGEKHKMTKKSKIVVDIDVRNCQICAAKPADQTLVKPKEDAGKYIFWNSNSVKLDRLNKRQ
jgi:hypothetical protein